MKEISFLQNFFYCSNQNAIGEGIINQKYFKVNSCPGKTMLTAKPTVKPIMSPFELPTNSFEEYSSQHIDVMVVPSNSTNSLMI